MERASGAEDSDTRVLVPRAYSAVHGLAEIEAAPRPRLIRTKERIGDDRQRRHGAVLHHTPQNVCKRVRCARMMVVRLLLGPFVRSREVPPRGDTRREQPLSEIGKTLVLG